MKDHGLFFGITGTISAKALESIHAFSLANCVAFVTLVYMVLKTVKFVRDWKSKRDDD